MMAANGTTTLCAKKNEAIPKLKARMLIVRFVRAADAGAAITESLATRESPAVPAAEVSEARAPGATVLGAAVSAEESTEESETVEVVMSRD
jgi:hypothetical protein